MKYNTEVDIRAPILPNEGLGNLKLRTHIKDYYDLVSSFTWIDSKTYEDCSVSLYSQFHIGYELRDTLVMVFHVLNGKLMKIIALPKYEGLLLGKIKVGMAIEDALKVESNLTYDEDEEFFFIKDMNGVVIETDENNEYIENISVYVQELDLMQDHFEKVEEFERGNW